MSDQRLTRFDRGPLAFDVLDTGPVDGVPVVLLHGFPQRASSWAAVAAELHDRGVRTYAPDQRGYSPGARPRSRFAHSLGELVADTLALVDAIGAGPVHLVGHDWGSAVAWSTAASRPDAISSLTAVSVPHPAAFLRAMVTSSQALRSSYMALFQLPYLPELLLGRREGIGERALRRAGMTTPMIEAFRTEVVADGALRGGLGYYRSMLLGTGGVGRPVEVPTTHVWSDGDVALTQRGADLTARYVTGPYRLEIMHGVSHWIPDESPAELAAIIAARVGV